MKFLIVVIVVVLVGWLLLRNRKDKQPPPAPRAAAPEAHEAQAMVECMYCGVHLPRSDAVEDSRGSFCTEAHRLAGPRRD